MEPIGCEVGLSGNVLGGLSERLNHSKIFRFRPEEDVGGLVLLAWDKVMVPGIWWTTVVLSGILDWRKNRKQ